MFPLIKIFNWTGSAYTGGSPILDYRYQYSTNGGATWVTGVAGPASARSSVVSGLSDNTTYLFRIAARSAVAWSITSNRVTVTTPSAIAAPAVVTTTTTTVPPTTTTTTTPTPTTTTTTPTTTTTTTAVPFELVAGVVWLDADGDGVRDDSESRLGGVEVRLVDDTGSVLAATIADGQGQYELAITAPNETSVEFVLPAGYDPTLADVGSDDTVDSDGIDSPVDPTVDERTARVALDALNDRAHTDLGLVVGPVTPTTQPATSTTAPTTVPDTTPTTVPATSTTPTTSDAVTTTTPATTVPATSAPTTAEPATTAPATTEPATTT